MFVSILLSLIPPFVAETENDIIQISPLPSPGTPRLPLAICILPPEEPRAPFLKEALVFHTLMGAASMVIYASLLPHTVLATSHKLQTGTDVKGDLSVDMFLNGGGDGKVIREG